ncbi:MAG TPA: SCP2 sterol-binding domain-containing protein, partial [Spirochaetota bacterium]|nr:SCP2 sterol-binding domain-containing protein [Spirochaetota bacterium]
MEYWGVKVEDIFNTMHNRFRPEGAKGVVAEFGYDIIGEGKWKIKVNDGELEVIKTDDISNCVAVMVCDGETFVGINIGKVDATNAFTSGKVKVEGDFGQFGKTAKMFKKFVLKKAAMSVRDYILDMFGTLVQRFQPNNAPQEAIIVYDIGGEDGGVWTAYIKDGKCDLKEESPAKFTVKLEVQEAKDWVDVML